jgi:hypothetical protein
VNTSSFERTATHVMLVLFSVLALAPLLVVVLAAMHPSGAILSGFGLPDSFSLSTFRTAWNEGGFRQLMTSSAIVAVAVVLLGWHRAERRRGGWTASDEDLAHFARQDRLRRPLDASHRRGAGRSAAAETKRLLSGVSSRRRRGTGPAPELSSRRRA